MQVIGSLILAVIIGGLATSAVRPVYRAVVPPGARQRIGSGVRSAGQQARGRLPAARQQQLDAAVRQGARAAGAVRHQARRAVPVVQRAAQQARRQGPAAKPVSTKPVQPGPAARTAAPAAGTARVIARPEPAPPVPAPSQPQRKEPPVTQPQPQSQAASPGTTGADLFAAMRVLVTRAETGGLRAKMRALATLSEVLGYEAVVLDGMATRLAEPDQGYPASVWEQVGTCAAHVRAGQNAISEASSALAHLVNLTLAEASASGQRIPHHDQVNSGT